MEYKTNTYDFAFTAASLRLNELILVAKDLFERKDPDILVSLGGGKQATFDRKYREYKKRLMNLTETQRTLFLKSDLTSQKQLGFLSICKTYSFIREFITEVLREKYLLFDYQLTPGDYISFVRRKEYEHEEITALTESTKKKIRTVLFLTLEEVGIIDNVKSKFIQPQLLDGNVINAILDDNFEWLKVFLVSETDIKNLKEKHGRP